MSECLIAKHFNVFLVLHLDVFYHLKLQLINKEWEVNMLFINIFYIIMPSTGSPYSVIHHHNT